MNHLTNNPGQPYVLNTSESIIPVNIAPAGETAHWIKCRLRRPTRDELFTRERESKIETKPIAGGQSIIITNDREANINLFRKIVLGVSGLTQDGREIPVGDQLFAAMETGWMNRAIQGYYSGSAKVRWNPAMAYVDSDQRGFIFVTHEFGTQELPDYVADWKFKKPDELVMADFRLNSQKIATGGGGRRAKSTLITDLAVAERTFREIFSGVEGAALAVANEAGDGLTFISYSEETREEYIENIDPVIKRDAVQVVMDYLEGQLQD